ncbi:MAG: putative monovalent cation/H+ antiporter subunit A [Caldithrix sp.]|nr:putative monovalent cation/H+ antiporter subunit A [Caldithrix sp.]
MELLLMLLAVFALAALAPLLYSFTRGNTGWLLAIFPFMLTAYLLLNIPQTMTGHSVQFDWMWIHGLDIHLAFYLDGLSLIFSILVTGIGGLILLFTGQYLGNAGLIGRFYSYLLLFMGSMLGLLWASDLITLFVFWELTSISSYLLIGYNHEDEQSRRAALQALLITAGGGLLLLAGFLLLAQIGGSFSFHILRSSGRSIQHHALYPLILILILFGAFTKSAQFPFHFWLPNAMKAPTPVSAFLHSATMVKAGIYLLARLNPVLGQTELWHMLISTTGAVTMLMGAILAIRQVDLKKILAYSTISALGTLVLLMGLDTKAAFKAALVFLLVHSFYKGALFMITGAIDHSTGSRDIRHLSNLKKSMPMLSVSLILASFSLAGLPPLLGFISKELVYEAKLQAPNAAWLITSFGVLANMLMVALAATIVLRPVFSGKSGVAVKHPPSAFLLVGPIILSALGLVVGLYPQMIAASLLEPALIAIQAEVTTIKLALWHGVNPVLLLSLLTFLGGVIIYILTRLYPDHFKKPLLSQVMKADTMYDDALDKFLKLAKQITLFIQHGNLRYYLFVTLLTISGLLLFYLLTEQMAITLPVLAEIRVSDMTLLVLILLSALMMVLTGSRILAIVALGVIGYAVALIFFSYGAPDLAMTQFSIETLSIIVFVLVLRKLPKFSRLSGRLSKTRDAFIALLLGGIITVISFLVMHQQPTKEASTFFTENSYTAAKGKNIVNVILVDFRALDTLGEITVLAIAAIGIVGMLKLKNQKGTSSP